MKIDQLRGMTQSVTEMIQKAGTQHAMAGEALSEYTAIAQTGARKPNPDDLRSTEIAAKERADRQQKEAKAAFKQWVQKQLTTAGAGMRKAFTGLFALGGPEALSAEKHMAQAMKQLNQAIGALKDEATSSYSVQDSNDIQIRRAKAHHFKAGSGFYVDGGPTVVLSAVSQVLRAHGFYIEADTLGVVADSEIHRLVNSYALDAERMSLFLRKAARIESNEAVELVTPLGTVKIDGNSIDLSMLTSSIKITPQGIDIIAPTINLIGVVGIPGGAMGINPAPIPVGMTEPIELVDGVLSGPLPELPLIAGAIARAQLELDPVQPQSAKKAQTPLPQWKGRLPQPWAR